MTKPQNSGVIPDAADTEVKAKAAEGKAKNTESKAKTVEGNAKDVNAKGGDTDVKAKVTDVKAKNAESKAKNGAKKNLHADHRKRCFETYFQDNVNMKIPDHILLEVLLFYSIPRKDTNEIAHRLLERFETLESVLSAPVHQLERVEGVGRYSANLIKLFDMMHRRCLEAGAPARTRLSGREQYGKYIVKHMEGLEIEALSLLCLDASQQLIGFSVIRNGVEASVEVDIKEIIRRALNNNAYGIVVSHNHPSGKLEPSDQDITATRMMMRACDAVNVKFLDHLIITDGKYASVLELLMKRRAHVPMGV